MKLKDFKTQYTLLGLNIQMKNKMVPVFKYWVAIIAWRGPDQSDDEPLTVVNAKTGEPLDPDLIDEYWDIIGPAAAELHDNLRKE